MRTELSGRYQLTKNKREREREIEQLSKDIN